MLLAYSVAGLAYMTCMQVLTDHAIAVGVDLVRDAATGQVLRSHVDCCADDHVCRRASVVVRWLRPRYAVVTHLRPQRIVQQYVGTIQTVFEKTCTTRSKNVKSHVFVVVSKNALKTILQF